MSPLPRLIFASRWLQLPLYIGLILAQGVYVWQFWLELVHLIEAAFGNQAALATLVTSTGYQAAPIFGADGSITPGTSQTVNYGADQVFTICLLYTSPSPRD